MAHIVFVTCERWPNISASDNQVADALRQRGHVVEPVTWQDDVTRLQSADLILLRSQWDYHYDLAAFTTWLDHVEAATLPVYNPVSLVRWNLHKDYLFDLQTRGVLIPTSHLLPPHENPAPIFQRQDWSQAVIKPLAGASGHLVARVTLADLPDWSAQTQSQRADGAWLIQEFRPEIQVSGEWSMIFLAGHFSHAVVKRPTHGEYRVNSQYAGEITRQEPALSIVQQAQQILTHLPVMPLYARVDGIVTADGDLCLIELELNEPGLYFNFAPEQAVHFAKVISDLLV
ncbi:hypothetical protein GC175_13355 [bacterium]|nr:hypothetical protein [bacterium]